MKLHDLLPKQKPFTSAVVNLYLKEYAVEFDINTIIYEGEYKTYPRQDLIKKIKNELKLTVYPDEHDPNNILVQFLPRFVKVMPKLLQQVQLYGWFISGIETDTEQEYKGSDEVTINNFLHSGYREAIITLEPKYSDEFKTPKLLYHVTPISVWETKIKQYGLSPKSKSVQSFHLERVYVTTTADLAIELIKPLANAGLNNASNQHYDSAKFNPKEYYKKWVVLEIDTTKISSVDGYSYFRVHIDHNTDSFNQHVSLYTQNYIPPVAIRIIKPSMLINN
jgi:hypothetical protein